MSGNTGTIKLTLEMDDKGTVKVLKAVGSESDKTGKKGKDAFDKMDKSAKTFSKSANAGAKSIVNMKTAVVALISAGGVIYLKSMAISFTDAASQAKNLEVALNTLTKGKGVETFEALNYWALKMPVNTQEAILTFQKLRAFGLEPTLKDMTTLVDASSALGGDKGTMPGIARALGQMSTNQKVLREELNQLAERGIPAVQILQEELGVTADQLQDVGNAGLDVNEVLNALMVGMEKRFGGASAKFMKEWSGMIESSKSVWFEYRRAVMESGPFDAMKEGLGEFLDYLATNEGQMDLKTWAQNTAIGVLKSFEWMVRGADAFEKSIAGIRIGFASMMQLTAKAQIEYYETMVHNLEHYSTRMDKTGTVTVNIERQQKVAASLQEYKSKLEDARITLDASNKMIEGNSQAILDNDKAYENLIQKIQNWQDQTKDIKLFGGAKDIDGAGIGNDVSNKTQAVTQELLNSVEAALDKSFSEVEAYENKIYAVNQKFSQDYKQVTMSTFDFERDQLTAQYNEYSKYVTDKVALMEWYGREMARITQEETKAAEEAAKKLREANKNTFDYMAEATVDWSSTFASKLNDIVWGSEKSFGATAAAYGKMLTEMMIKKELAEPMMEWAGAGISSFGGWMMSAKGNAFDKSGHIQTYGHGGAFTNKIVDKPTLFAHGGGFGVLGELGKERPEVIAPLFRASNGDMGVKAVVEGGGSTFVFNNTFEFPVSDSADESRSKQIAQLISSSIKQQVIGVIREEKRYGGMLHRPGGYS